MSLTEKMTEDMKTAMKAGEKVRLSTIRLLISAVKNKAKDLRQETLSDEDIHTVVATLIRQRQDSIEQYRKGGRDDLADREAEEIEVLKAYQPAQLSADEIREIAKKAAVDAGATGPGDMGKVMKAVMPQVKGRADGRQVQEIVKEVLGG